MPSKSTRESHIPQAQALLPGVEPQTQLDNSFLLDLFSAAGPEAAGGEQDERVQPIDVIYEQMAHRMAYQSSLHEEDKALLARWGYQPQWFMFKGAEDLEFVLFMPAEGSDKVPVVAFRGTEPSSWTDIEADLAPEIGQTQFQANRQLIDDVFSRIGTCDVIGHSLGAALAQRAAVEYGAQVRTVVGFQAPSIASDSASEYDRRDADERADIRYHLADNDLVDLGGEQHLGGQFMVHEPRDHDNAVEAHLGYFFMSPQHASVREELGLTDDVLDTLDRKNAAEYDGAMLDNLTLDRTSYTESTLAEEHDEYHRPGTKEVVEGLRSGIGDAYWTKKAVWEWLTND